MIRLGINDEKIYKVEQGNEYRIVDPSSVSGAPNYISWSWNTFNAEFIDRLIARKVSIKWTFDGPPKTGASLEDLVAWLDQKAMAGNRFFLVTTWCPGLGWIKFMSYWGTPDQFTGEGIKAGTSKEMAISKGTLDWIEVGGDGKAGVGDKTIINDQVI